MNIGSVLSCTPHIVQNIFQHLTAKDLGSCASVCSLWAVLSKEEICRRKGIVPFFQEITVEKRCSPFYLTHQVCQNRQFSRFESELKDQLQNADIKPAFCIAFATTAFLEYFEQLFPAYFDCNKQPRKRRKKCYWDYFNAAVEFALRKHLPPTCCISLYLQSNLAFYPGDSHSDLVKASSPAICGYLFPEFPDGELKFYTKEESFGQILKHINKNGYNDRATDSILQLAGLPYFEIALTKQDAFASAIIMPVWMASNYIPVFEGPNVLVFRFATGEHYLPSAAKMEQWKKEMKGKKGLTGYTIAFMFSIEYYNYYKACEVFREVFPDVPLISMFQCLLDVPLNFEFDQNRALRRKVILKSGLKHHSVFIFVTFNA